MPRIHRSQIARRIARVGLSIGAVMFSVSCSDIVTPSTPPAATGPAATHLIVAPTDLQRIGSNGNESCAIDASGVVRCWGDNSNGIAPMTRVAAVGSFVQISVGFNHACAVRSDGVVECWGTDESGDSPATKSAATGTFIQVSSGRYHTCALRTDGQVECWGDNSGLAAPAVRAPLASTYTQISVGFSESCGLRADGAVECWGQNGDDPAGVVTVADIGVFTQLSEGTGYRCAVRSDGFVQCWGNNNQHQAPGARQAAVGNFVYVAAAWYHTCAVRDDGVAECWGLNTGSFENVGKAPVSGKFVQIAVGFGHNCAMRIGGTVECWGGDYVGQLEFGSVPTAPSSLVATTPRVGMIALSWADNSSDEAEFRINRRSRFGRDSWSAWTLIASPPAGTATIEDDSITAGLSYQYKVHACNIVGCSPVSSAAAASAATNTVAAGMQFSCLLPGSGTVECFGDNAAGNAPPYSTPAFGRYLQISAGTYGACALRSDGSAVCLHDGGDLVTTPTSGAFTQVASGGAHACALRDDGNVQCWGDDTDGQAPPLRAPLVGRFIQVVAGLTHTCALRGDGIAECWGNTADGRSQATRGASAGGSFRQLSAGFEHTCGLRVDGGIECWGLNQGDQAPGHWSAGAGTFTQVSAGGYHTCGLDTDGVAECRGANGSSQAPSTKAASSGHFIELGSGFDNNCGWRTDGAIECWGDDSHRQSERIVMRPVTGVTASVVSATEVDVTWSDRNSGEAYALVQRRQRGSDGIWGSWFNVASPSQGDDAYSDESPANNTNALHYAYRVEACAPNGCSAWTVSNTTSPAAPTRPTNLTIGVTVGRISLGWTVGDRGTRTAIERRVFDANTATWGGWQTFATVGGLQQNYDDQSVVPGSRYQYRFRACNIAHCSSFIAGAAANAIDTPPAAPTSLVATASSATQVGLGWVDNSGDEASFEIQRRAQSLSGSNGAWVAVTALGADATSYNDLVATNTARLTYRVRACKPGGCSTWAVSNSATTVTAPAAPTNIGANTSVGHVIVTWSDASNNEGRFEVQRRTWNASTRTYSAWEALAIAAADTTLVHDFSPVSGTRYQYRVRSCNVVGCSAWIQGVLVDTP